MTSADDYALPAVPAVEHALGYRFREPRLLLTALTHRSFSHENSTESGDFDELEWLGDSVLQLAVSSWLFRSASGSQRSAHQLTLARQRFVDAGACKSFANQLNLVPYLRIGQQQPVQGTKILADCFEAVLGAVYVDSGGCSDLQPVHDILARVIRSYDLGSGTHRARPAPPHGLPTGAGHEVAKGEEPRKLMNLTHRLIQIAKRTGEPVHDQSGGHPPGAREEGSTARGAMQPDHLEVLREFDRRLRVLQESFFRGGTLSYAAEAFADVFGPGVAEFYAAVTESPEGGAVMDKVMAGSENLRKHFPDAPQGAERVVMDVVPIPSEIRLQCFTVTEFLVSNVLRQEVPPEQSVLGLVESAPNGSETANLLRAIAEGGASCLMFSPHQRSVIAAAAAPAAAFAASATGERTPPSETPRTLSPTQRSSMPWGENRQLHPVASPDRGFKRMGHHGRARGRSHHHHPGSRGFGRGSGVGSRGRCSGVRGRGGGYGAWRGSGEG